jgi:hypothetical protein
LGGRKALLMLDELARYAARPAAADPRGSEQLAAFPTVPVFIVKERIHPDQRTDTDFGLSAVPAQAGDAANRWAMAGMKIMLAGQPKDPNIEKMLEDLRQRY